MKKNLFLCFCVVWFAWIGTLVWAEENTPPLAQAPVAGPTQKALGEGNPPPLEQTPAAGPDQKSSTAKNKQPLEQNPAAEGVHQALTLQDCYQLALKRMETIGIKAEEIEVAQAQIYKALSEGLFDADFYMTDFRQERISTTSSDGATSSFNRPHQREREFTIKQPLFQGFRAIAAFTAAGSLKGQRKDEWKRAEQLLFLDVATAFNDLLRLKSEVRIIEGIRQLFKERIAELEDRVRIGRSRSSEVVTVVARLKGIESELALSQGTLEVAKYLLEFLTGVPVEIDQLQEEDMSTFEMRSLRDYLAMAQSRFDVLAARQAEKVTWRGIILAQSGLWPQLSLENNDYVRREGFQSGIDWDVLITADIPLFRGGETFGKIKEAISKWKQAKLSYSLTKRQAELDVQQAYERLMTAVNVHRALEEAVGASEENFHLQREDYKRSLVNNLDVLAALETLHQDLRDTNTAYHRMKINYWSLRVAAGEVS